MGMKKRLIAALCVLFWLAVWQIGAMLLDQKILLVTPVETIKRLFELVFERDFWKSVAFSSWRILLGFLLGLSAGTLLALLSWKVSVVRALFSPFMTALKAIPVASFTILALFWTSPKNLSVLISFLICLPIVYANMLAGCDSLDPKLTEMAKVFRVPAPRRFAGIYLSQLLPHFSSGAGLAIGLCWKSGVAAEVIGIPDGSLGEKLFVSKVYLETADLFAFTLVVILASWACEKLFMMLLHAAVRRVEKM